tara:strand:+ start:629 stop:1447 length:819 start_codon:yes stop_codon:yes gene_type:complete
MNPIFKKIPNDNWLTDLDQYRIKEKPLLPKKPKNKGWYCKGPWYSDDGEDGVLDYLFEYINDVNKYAVDIGSAHGYGGSHVRYLADKYGWGTTEIDGKRWKRMHPRIKNEIITPNNICELLTKYGTPKNFDLLSLDIDSMDWYVLEKLLLGDFRPSVAIVEFNPIFEYNEGYVVKYDKTYKKDGTSQYGASVKAYEMLMNKYNYTLVHIFPKGVNNLLFISNNFILPTIIIDTIKNMHSKSYIEHHKIKGNEKNYISKENLIKNKFNKLTQI